MKRERLLSTFDFARFTSNFSRIVLIFGLGLCVSCVTAQKNLLAELVSAVEADSQVLKIDAAIYSINQVCVNRQSNGLSGDAVRYHAASISKLLTAMVIMQLRDEGRLELTDKVGLYEPRFANSPIKLDQLLTHTSGLRDKERARQRTTTGEVDVYIDALATQRVQEMPSQWRYADANFNLLGRVIEHVTNASYSDALQNRIIGPLAMTQSEFKISTIPQKSRALAYDNRGRALAHPWDLAFIPSSGLQTTAGDLIKFSEAVLKMRENEEGGLLRRESLNEMTKSRTQTGYHGVSQGLGWQLAATEMGPQWRHAGGEKGFESLLTIYPQKQLAVVLLGNQKDWPRFKLERNIRRHFKNKENVCTFYQGD